MGRAWAGVGPGSPTAPPPAAPGREGNSSGAGGWHRGVSAAVRARGSSCSTRLGGLGEGPQPWAVTSWDVVGGWPLVVLGVIHWAHGGLM